MQRISGSQPIPSTAASSVHLELLAHHPCRSNRPCLGRRCCRALHSCRPALADRLRRSCRENPRHQVRLSINATSSNNLSVLPPELAPHCAQMCAGEGANLEGRLCRGCHSCPQGLARPGRRGHRGHQVCPERLTERKRSPLPTLRHTNISPCACAYSVLHRNLRTNAAMRACMPLCGRADVVLLMLVLLLCVCARVRCGACVGDGGSLHSEQQGSNQPRHHNSSVSAREMGQSLPALPGDPGDPCCPGEPGTPGAP